MPHQMLHTPAMLCTLALLRATVCATGSITNLEGKRFLEENAKKEGVVVLPSGLQYKVVRPAARPGRSPHINDPCTCHYEGRQLNGKVFDSSRQRSAPETFAPNQVIKGWTEALQLMQEGDHWQLFIPSELAYGSRGSPPEIAPGEALVFDIELIKVDVARVNRGVLGLTKLLNNGLPWMLLLVFMVAMVSVCTSLLIQSRGSDGIQKVAVCHILVKDEKECIELKEQLLKETSEERFLELFRILAGKHSICSSSKVGGSLGYVGRGDMIPAFEQVCWSAPLGSLQGPVETIYGFHLLIVTEHISADMLKAKEYPHPESKKDL